MRCFSRVVLVWIVAMCASSWAHAQATVQVRGTMKNIPFPTSCPTSGNTVYSYVGGQLQVTFSCNGISYTCQALPLKDNPDQLANLVVGASPTSASTLNLNCGPLSTVSRLQVYIARFFNTLTAYMADPMSQTPSDRHCFFDANRTASDAAYSPAARAFTYQCAVLNPTPSDNPPPSAVSCYMVSEFGYSTSNTTLLVPACIDASLVTNSPYLFEDAFEDVASASLTPQVINFTNPAAQTYSLTGTFTLSATGGGSGSPIIFASTTSSVCTVTGQTVSIVSAGTCTLTANQAGNLFYSAAPEVSRSVVIARANQTISFTPPSAQAFSTGGTFSLSATGGGSGNPVVFVSLTPSVCTIAGSTVTMVSVGTCTINALQGGNGNYNAATPVSADVTIGQASQTINFTAPTTQVYASTPFVVTATATSGLTVVVTTATPLICTVSGLNVTTVAAGTCVLNANQAGNASYLAATQVTRNVTITRADQTITFTPPSAQTFSAGGTFSLSATGGASGNPVVFNSTTTAVCTVAGNTATIVAVGTCTISATQAGNSNYNAATPVSADVTIGQASQTINFTAPATQAYSSTPFVITATATSGLTVVVTSTTPLICTISGFNVTTIAVGTCVLNANQAGNSGYLAATQVTRNISIARANQAITFTPPSAQIFSAGGTFSLSATGGASGNPIVFNSTTTAVCTVAGNTATIVAVGTCTISATQAGNSNYNAATPVSVDVTISQASQTINFTAPTAPQDIDAGTFSVTATATSGLTVVVTSATPLICTVSGLSVTPVEIGTCVLNANQSGNSNYSAAAQVVRNVVIDRI
jgi:hypothetical protein